MKEVCFKKEYKVWKKNKKEVFMKATTFYSIILYFILFISIIMANEVNRPPIKGIPKLEQPIFTGYSKSYRSESNTFEHIASDINKDGLIDSILLPHLILNPELDGAKKITTFLASEGGSIKIDPVITENNFDLLQPPLIRAQGVIGNFVKDLELNDDLVMTAIKANLFTAVKIRQDYIFAVSQIGEFIIMRYIEQPFGNSIIELSSIYVGGYAYPGCLDIDYANNIAAIATSSGLYFIDIFDKNNPIIKSTVPALTTSFKNIKLGMDKNGIPIAYALEATPGIITILRIFNISDISNPKEYKNARIKYICKDFFKDCLGSSLDDNKDMDLLAISFYQLFKGISDGAISLIDISEPSNPQVFNYFIPKSGWIKDLSLLKADNIRRLYYVAYDAVGNKYLSIYDIFSIKEPKFIIKSSLTVFPRSIKVDNLFRAYFSSAIDNKMIKLDVSDDEPEEVCFYYVRGAQMLETDVSLSAMRAFIAANGAGIHVLDIMQTSHCLFKDKYQKKSIFIIYKGIGNGAFEIMPNYPIEFSEYESLPSDIAAADFNKDGELDIAIADWGLEQIIIGYGEIDSDNFVFSKIPLNEGTKPLKLIADDFNKDGNTDIVFISSDRLPMEVGTPNIYEFSESKILKFDLHYLQGNGDGTFQNVIDAPIVYNPEDIYQKDFNNDGYIDLAVVDTETGKVQFLMIILHINLI